MKYICQPSGATARDPDRVYFDAGRCTEHLRQWAKDCRLVTAAFFFWNSGVELQTNQEGLMRTLLYQILFQATELIPLVSPHLWEALCLFDHNSLVQDCTKTEVEQMFVRLLEIVPADIRLCCFVDRLDEFQGDPALLIELVKRMVDNPNIKMCVASRPWTAFEDAFHQKPRLLLEDLTKGDIKSFTTSKLMKEVAFRTIQQFDPIVTENLIDFVVRKASGVFLWVSLVVASLIVGMRDGDRLCDLQKRLEELPTKLEDLFASMIASLQPDHLAHAAAIFELMQSQPDPPSVLLLSFADEESHQSALKRLVKPLEKDEAAIMYDSLRRRLKSRTMGLLEVSTPAGHDIDLDRDLGFSPAALWRSSVQYLHRTVRDYLRREDVHTQFRKVLDPRFDVHFSMCVGQLCALKTMHKTQVVGTRGTFSQHFYDCVSLFMQHASQLREDSGVMIVPLLDDLDQSAVAILRRDLGPPRARRGNPPDHRAPGQWVKLYNLEEYRSHAPDLVAIACHYGVTPYVAARAPSKTPGSPALLSEVIDDSRHHRYRGLNLSVPTFSCLLAKGYTLDETLEYETGWKLLIRRLAWCQGLEDKAKEAACLQAAELAFRAGNPLPARTSPALWRLTSQLLEDRGTGAHNLRAAYDKLEEIYRTISIPPSQQPNRLRLRMAELRRFFRRLAGLATEEGY